MIPETIKIVISLLLLFFGVKIINKYIIIDDREERNKYYDSEEYSKLIDIGQNIDPRRQQFYSFKYEMILLYFMDYDLENYRKVRNSISPLVRLYRHDYIIISIMDILVLYLEGEVKEARNLFFKIEKKTIKYLLKNQDLKNGHFWELVYFPKYYFENSIEDVKRLHEEYSNDDCYKYAWAIMNYYLFLVYSRGDNEQKQLAKNIKEKAFLNLKKNGYINLFKELEV